MSVGHSRTLWNVQRDFLNIQLVEDKGICQAHKTGAVCSVIFAPRDYSDCFLFSFEDLGYVFIRNTASNTR
jgi:hypothetical protein